MGSVLETDSVCFFNDIKSLSNKHSDGLPIQCVPGHPAGLKARMGDSSGPSSPGRNHCDFSLFFFYFWRGRGLPEGIGDHAPPCQPLGPQGEDHQGVKQSAGGHCGQSCLWDEEKVPEAVESLREKRKGCDQNVTQLGK
jgi:hypothetical protein